MSDVQLPTWHQTIDFDSLMVEARKHITELAGQLWTDHNSSDPGITQLEVLAFCIADLSYRTSFDVKDILTGYKGGKLLDIDLPLADVALSNQPVTIKDLRKVLIDMPHPDSLPPDVDKKLLVRNAYPIIAERTEVPFYAVSRDGNDAFLSFDTHYEDDYLTAEETQSELSVLDDTNVPLKRSAQLQAAVSNASQTQIKGQGSVAGEYSNPTLTPVSKEYKYLDEIILNGLYALQIEFEEQEDTDEFLSDLNQNYFKEKITVDGQEYVISVLFPYWDEINWLLKDVDLQDSNTTLSYRKRDTQAQEDYFIAVDKLNYDDYFYDYYAEVDANDHKITAFIKVETKSAHTITIQGKQLNFEANFLDWNELSNGVQRQYDNASPNVANASSAFERVKNVSVGDEHVYDIRSKFSYLKNGTTNKDVYLLTRIIFDKDAPIDTTMESQILDKLEDQFPLIYSRQIALEERIFDLMEQKNASIYANYLEKINVVFNHLYGEHGIWNYLGSYRNLCEDFSQFSASRVQEIALFGKIIVEPGVNVNQLLGEVYYRVDEFLDPLVRFHTLSEMTNLGKSFQEIFNGPLLSSGFILDEDLENLKRRSVIYTSDLIRIIMDVPGVLAVEDFNISSYIDNRLMGRNVINCLSLTNSQIYKPRFSAEKTGLTICVDDKEAELNEKNFKDWYAEKLRLAKLNQLPSGKAYELELPEGRDMEIEAYRSIQHDFPEVYGIGEFGLPTDATEERKSRAKQLKGYLLPFEQLLTNYLKQVAHLPELFSYNRTIEDTYSMQPLYDVPDVAPLFSGFSQNPGDWEAFKLDVDNSYEFAMREGESDQTFRDRRNRFLSQQISRFGESFTEYARQMFDRHKHLLNDPAGGITAYRNAQAATLEDLIEDKIAFGEDYQKVSSGRYQSFNTTIKTADVGTGTWNNGNIGDFKRRLCRLLGIETLENTPLFGSGTDDDGHPIDIEGMHILEHILLRPRTNDTFLLDLNNRPKENGGTFIYEADKDPYSFRITVVLPINAGRFNDEGFRAFTERLIRMETPAHIGVDFKWLSTICGQRFEEHYSAWKKAIYLMKPWYFQQPIEGVDLPMGELRAESEVASGTKRVSSPSIIDLQNNLIGSLNTPCLAQMQLYDGNDQLHVEVSNVVRFIEGTTDVFNVKLSHVGGSLTVLKFNEVINDWEQKVFDDYLPESYSSVEEYTADSTIGLTEFLGGVGRYALSYTLGSFPTVTKIVEVLPAPVPVKIYIGNQDMMLDFDTEKDGTFKRTNNNWEGYFLQFFNYREGAQITIVGNGVNAELNPGKKGSNISFKKIYEEFGAGVYQVNYTLDGESTFAEIEIGLELKINAFVNDKEKLPGEDLITVIDVDEGPLKLDFILPGGTLKVTDLDAVLPIPSETSGKKSFFEDDQYVVYEKQIDQLTLDLKNDDRFVNGHHYRFHYSLGGAQTSRIFRLIKTVKPQPPKIKLLHNGLLLDGESPLLDPRNGEYAISLSPAGYQLTIVSELGVEMLKIEEITEDQLQLPLDPAGYTHLKEGDFIITYGDDTVQSQRKFSVPKRFDPVVDDSILIRVSTTNDQYPLIDGVFNLHFDYTNPELFYTFWPVNRPGELFLTDEDDNKYAFSVGEEELPRFEGQQLNSGTYDAVYQSGEGEKQFQLEVLNPNPTFELQSIRKEGNKYEALAIPLYPYGKSYIWRLDGKFKTRAKQPEFVFDFSEKESFELELTLHYQELEPAHKLIITEAKLEEWMNG